MSKSKKTKVSPSMSLRAVARELIHRGVDASPIRTYWTEAQAFHRDVERAINKCEF